MVNQSMFGGGQSPHVASLQAYFGGLDSLAQSMSPLRGVARWQLEVFGLMSRRAQAYLELPSRLQQCRTPQDLVNEQARFLRTSFEQYTQSTQQLAEAWTQIGGGNFSQAPSNKPVARDYITFGTDERVPASRANGHDRRAA